jgi:hypothetical protein
MTSQLGRIQLGRFQLGQYPAPTPTGSFTATAAPTLGPVYGSGLFTGTCGAPTLVVRGSGGTPLSKFSGVLGTIQLGRFWLGRPQSDAALNVDRSQSIVGTASPLLSITGEVGSPTGSFTATASPTATVRGETTGFLATASPQATFFGGGSFTATANPAAQFVINVLPQINFTADPQLSFFTSSGQPVSCVSANDTPAPDPPTNWVY